MATTATRTTTNAASASEAPFIDHPLLTPQKLKLYGIGAAVLIVVALIVWFVVTSGQRKEAFANVELERARDAAGQQNYGVAVQGFTRIVNSYGGTSAAYEANLGIAQTQIIEGQNQLAATTLANFVRTNPPAIYGAAANSLLGTAYENLGKFDESLGAYRQASNLAVSNYLKASSLLDAGRAATLAHKTDEAKSIYNEIITKYAKTGAVTEAQVRLAELTAAG
jgi:TolA-binding protein